MARGSVTVFFSLIFTVVLALICTVIESARMYGAGVRAKSTAYIAMESEFAGYSKQVFDDYGVLLLWDENGINQGIENYIRKNSSQVQENGFSGYFDILQLSLESIEEQEVNYVTDNGGDEFVKQILEYQKIAAVGDVAEQLLGYLQSYQDSAELEQDEAVTAVVENIDLVSDEDIAILQDMVLSYQESVKKLKSIDIGDKSFKDNVERLYDKSDSDRNDLQKSELRKLIKYFKKLKKKLEYMLQEMNGTIAVAEEYIVKKNDILKKYNLKNSSNETADYIDDENITLENSKGLIIGVIKNYLDRGIAIMEAAVEKEELLDKKALKKDFIVHINSKLIQVGKDISMLTGKNDTQKYDENTDLFEKARSLLKTGVLELVMPSDSEISSKAVSDTGLPSNDIEKSKEGILDNIVNKALFVYYISIHFSNFLVESGDNALQYEMEYILRGNYNDKDNLLGTVGELVAARQILNTVHMVSDTEKMSGCTQASTTISVGIGLPFLQPVIKLILMQAWALSESVWDVKALLAGGEVPLIKGADDWKTSFGSFTNISDGPATVDYKSRENEVSTGIKGDNSEKNGSEILKFTYKTYLQILLLLKNNEEMIYRTMDLIQANVNKNYNSSFRMAESITSAEVDITYTSPSVFTSLPFVQQILSKKPEVGVFRVNTRYGYTY